MDHSDSKKWKGKIEYKGPPLLESICACSSEARIEQMRSRRSHRIRRSQSLKSLKIRSVPIHPALAFVEGVSKFSVVFRDLLEEAL